MACSPGSDLIDERRRRKDFSNAMLAVKTLGPADFDEKGERKIGQCKLLIIQVWRFSLTEYICSPRRVCS